MIADFLLYLSAFATVWIGAGMVVSSVDSLARKINLSSFATSFFVLGILTSLPEMLVGVNSLLDKTPEIFVGNLIGASFVLFTFVIPLLAILGKGIKLAHQLDNKKLLLTLLVITAPLFYLADSSLNFLEGIFLILLYLFLFYSVEKKKGLLERVKDRILDGKSHLFLDFLKILGGGSTVFFGSKIIVDKTILLSQTFHVPPFLISLLVLSIGTNLPEISLALRSVVLGKKEVAFGDYIGSAAANTLIFGFLTVSQPQGITVSNHFLKTAVFIFLGLFLFYFFSRSKNDISQKEGLALFLVYLFFLFGEILELF